MKKTVIIIFLFIVSGISQSMCNSTDLELPRNYTEKARTKIMHYYEMYDMLGLKGKISRDVFLYAVSGYEKIGEFPNNILTIIDFSQPSSNERMFIIDMEKKKLLCSSVVSHGRNSGTVYATDFSNRHGSYKSSLGFYLTGNVYNGKNGYSLALDGLEKGINDKARERAIVVHGAGYCNPESVRNGGMLGRSLGCPAIPLKMTRQIIDTIKNGSLMFIYGNSRKYLSQSKFIEKSLITEKI